MSDVAIMESIYGPMPDMGHWPKAPTHCTACGRALLLHYERDGFHADGSPALNPTWRCPKTLGRWNRLTLGFMGHQEYELGNFIDWHWRERYYQ